MPTKKKSTKEPIPTLPDSVLRNSAPFRLSPKGWWLVIGDIHIPFHDRQTIELAVEKAKQKKIVGILLNGDIADCHELSRFDKTPDEPRYVEEVEATRQFLRWLRYKFPTIKIVLKDGNHEERLMKYLCQRAPALFGLDVATIPNILWFHKYGIEHVTDKRVIQAGKLNIVHGHEFPGGSNSPVNPARGLFLKAKASILGNHFHQMSEHHEPDIRGKSIAAWSLGCACGLAPMYLPLNKWCNGFAFVEILDDGDFEVENLCVMKGRLI